MNKGRVQIILACCAVLAATLAAEAFVPRTLMVRSSQSLDLEKAIPHQFGQWKAVPDVRVVEPPGSDTLSHEIYNQEVARGYADGEGHIIMLLVAYGASQSDRLQLHRPEICYGAQGFKVSRPAGVSLSYANGQPPISGTRLVASREGRLEPITYWMRIGNDVVSGVVERQILKVTYGLHGLIPDGTLIRISTVGMSEDSSFALQTRFVPEFIASLDPVARSLIVGDSAKALAFR